MEIAKEIADDYGRKVEAMLYAFATKFLAGEELEAVREVIKMTQLTKLIWEDGIEQGREQGVEAFVTDYLEEGFSKERIAEKLQKRFHITEQTAKNYVERYGKTVVLAK